MSTSSAHIVLGFVIASALVFTIVGLITAWRRLLDRIRAFFWPEYYRVVREHVAAMQAEAEMANLACTVKREAYR